MSDKQQVKKIPPGLRAVLDAVLQEGAAQLTTTPQAAKHNVDVLIDALLRAWDEPECEVRLTYKTTAQAAAAWNWMINACIKEAIIDKEKCSAFNVELFNRSAILFLTEENLGRR